MKQISLLIAELSSDGLFRISDILSSIPYINPIATVKSEAEAEKYIRLKSPDIIIIEAVFIGKRDLEFAYNVYRKYPDTRIIFFSEYNGKQVIQKSIYYGASGFVIRDIKVSRLIQAVNIVAQGFYYFRGGDIEEGRVKEPAAESLRNNFSDTENYKRECRILVVEDEDLNMRLFELVLSRIWFNKRIFRAYNGEDALRILDVTGIEPDITITGFFHPGKYNGLGLTREILKRNPLSKVLVCSSYSSKQMIKEAAGEGVKGFISKPVHQKNLSEAIFHVINGRKYFRWDLSWF
jgi:two-component system chemotaxis response regulator CheY